MNVGVYIVPVFLLVAFGMAFWNKTAAFDDFVDGAKDGIESVVSIVPNLVGMIVGTKVFLASGIVETLTELADPVLRLFNIEAATLPLMILRPLSGSASLSYASELIQVHGPDSLVGRLTSVIQASSDTTIYIITIYLAAVGIRNMRHALKLGLVVDLASFLLATVFVRIFFA
ncbi:MAG: spore maturation protein [Defluviitaleaceae bacterium]|nr:spore maturation protein [Defluviitaleaceae bacterium]